MLASDVVLEEIPSDSMESFGMLIYEDDVWDLSHLDSLAFQCELKPGFLVTVIVTSPAIALHGALLAMRACQKIPASRDI
ncbi:hypothetical protein [Candidatus Burkholderia verschuerenii]|uniref:hypothetical protein n=1 Tax=Candidatus Burkholderia verschuerenii TaxID=242163 RepID=UPI00067BEF30|nr:hypothetical protein [Candidatus Burkholderia verschuerenii]